MPKYDIKHSGTFQFNSWVEANSAQEALEKYFAKEATFYNQEIDGGQQEDFTVRELQADWLPPPSMSTQLDEAIRQIAGVEAPTSLPDNATVSLEGEAQQGHHVDSFTGAPTVVV